MRYFLSGLAGFIAASLLFFFIAFPNIKSNWRAQGLNEGALKAHAEIQRKVEKHFPTQPEGCTFIETLSGAKPDTVDVIQCGQFKTLSIVR